MAWGFDAQVGGDQWLEQRVQMDELKRRSEQDRIQNILRRIGSQEQTRQFDVNAVENARQFDEGLGLDKDRLGEQGRQFDAEEPTREAGRLLTGAQTADIQRRPQAEIDERAFEQDMLGRREASEGRLITRRADEDIRAQGVTASPQPGQGGPSEYSQERARRSIQSVDELIGKVGGWTAGPGSVLANIPGTDARDFSAQLETLKANIGFNELAEMRAASKTGGALGAISDREISLLSSVLGSLDPGQSPDALRGQLQKIKESLERWNTAQSGGGQPPPGDPPPGGGGNPDPLGLR